MHSALFCGTPNYGHFTGNSALHKKNAKAQTTERVTGKTKIKRLLRKEEP